MERLPEMTSKVTMLARAAGMEGPGRVADDATQRPDPEVPESGCETSHCRPSGFVHEGMRSTPVFSRTSRIRRTTSWRSADIATTPATTPSSSRRGPIRRNWAVTVRAVGRNWIGARDRMGS